MKKEILSEELLRMKRLAGLINEELKFTEFEDDYGDEDYFESLGAPAAPEVASFQNKFTPIDSDADKEKMINVYGDADDYPLELNSIISYFIGNYDNFAITKDGNDFNIYTWKRKLDGVKKIDSSDNLEGAKQIILSKNKKPF
jgi:hypothetical protein